MSENLTCRIELLDGRVLRHETPVQEHTGMRDSVISRSVVGERRYYVDDREVEFWSYDLGTDELKIIEHGA